MSNEHRNLFQPDSVYFSTQEIVAGFKRDQIVPIGSALKYIERKYSPYDGCYVYYFQPPGSAETLEIWVEEDMTTDMIRSMFKIIE